MKKLILVILLAIAFGAGNASAQTSKGSIAISGNFSTSLNDSERTNYSIQNQRHYTEFYNGFGITLSPGAGYFISDNVELGTGLELSYSRSKSRNDLESANTPHFEKNYSIGLSPYVRKYVPLTERLFLLGTGYVSAGVGKSVYQPGPDQVETNNTTFAVGVTPGLAYFITDRFALRTNVGSLSYRKAISRPETGPKYFDKRFGVDLSLSAVSFGLSYFITR